MLIMRAFAKVFPFDYDFLFLEPRGDKLAIGMVEVLRDDELFTEFEGTINGRYFPTRLERKCSL